MTPPRSNFSCMIIIILLVLSSNIIDVVVAFGVRLPSSPLSSSSLSTSSQSQPHYNLSSIPYHCSTSSSLSCIKSKSWRMVIGGSSNIGNGGISSGISSRGSDIRMMMMDGRVTIGRGGARRSFFQSYSAASTTSRLQASSSISGNNENQSNNNNADDNSQSSEEQQQQQQQLIIESWLLTHLPTLPPSDLQSYTTILSNDDDHHGLSTTSLEELNSMEDDDLGFMKKGHRRLLMKKIGQEESRIANKRVVVGAADEGVAERKKARDNFTQNETSSQEESRIGDEGTTTATTTMASEKSHQDRLKELEDLERDFKKRRADRIAEEEQLEQLLNKAKLEAAAREEEDAEKLEAGLRRKEEKEKEELERDLDDAGDAYHDMAVELIHAKLEAALRKEVTEKEKGAAESKLDDDAYHDITVDNIQERGEDHPLSLSTTMPPSNNRGVNKVNNNDSKGGEKDDIEEEECAVEDDECWDITRNAIFAKRTSQSLATTSRKNLAGRKQVRAASSSVVQDDDGGNGNDEFYDITQNMFPENIRRGRSLFRSLATSPPSSPPLGTRTRSAEDNSLSSTASALKKEEQSEMNDRRPAASTAVPSNSEKRKARNVKNRDLFGAAALTNAEKRNVGSNDSDTAFKNEEQFEMDDGRPKAAATVGGEVSKPKGEYFERQTAFKEEDKSEMNSRPASSSASASALFQKFRQSSSKSPSKESKATEFDGVRRNENEKAKKEEVFYDITQSSFPDRRSSFNDREKSEMNDRRTPGRRSSSGMPKWSSATSKKTLTNATPSIKLDDDDGLALDIASLFPEDQRPSLLVNTGTSSPKKRSGEVKKKRFDDSFREGVDIAKQFPGDRPSLSVNTGTERVRTALGLGESKGRSKKEANTKRKEDSSFVDITRQHFPKDRDAFISRVNSGTKKRGTTAGSYRDVAHNFSADRASLLGHPKRKVINTTPPKKPNGDNVQVDTHRFSSDLAPPSRSSVTTKADSSVDITPPHLDTHKFSSDLAPASRDAAATTNAVWRADSSTTKHEKYLDTPRAFGKNLDMVPPSKVKDVVTNEYLNTNPFSSDRKPPSSTNKAKKVAPSTNKARKTEADKYLNTNQFSWNLSPSTVTNKDLSQKAKATSSTTSQQPFLDTPRPFQSNVDMVSSNTSGVKHKRSSDIPPEEKHKKDYYDTATAPSMPRATATGAFRSKKKKEEEESDGGEYFDITRVSMSRLERTSSVVIDANKSSSKVRPNGNEDKIPSDDNGSGDQLFESNTVQSSDDDDEESSYEEVMYWLLTHLPQLQEEDAITYFNYLLEDGFDSVDMLREVLEEDLYFMKRGHQQAVLRNIHGEDGEISAAMDDDEEVDEDSLEYQTEAASDDRGNAIDDDEFEYITRNSFVERPSNSLAASQPNPEEVTKHRKHDEDELDDEKEEFYDITRDAFSDRPALEERSEGATKSSPPSSNDASKEDNTTQLPAQPSQNVSEGAPRAELHQYYIKKGLTSAHAQKLKDYFTTWTNGAKSHELKFTCIFTCPMTGEHFACGSWMNGGEVDHVEDQIFWYKNKKQAMNAAAAKALDCFSLRECHGTDMTPIRRCQDAPVSEEDAPVLPTLPTGIDLPTILIQSGDSSHETQG